MTAPTETATVRFTLNGRAVSADADETLLDVARREGVEIPTLCYQEGLRTVGSCRACMVEIEGERILAPSCCRRPAQGMQVQSDSPRARRAQQTVLELLRTDVAAQHYTRDSELDGWCDRLGLGQSRLPGRDPVTPDPSHPAIAVNLDACIHCTRCVRACREAQANDVIGVAFRGEHTKIVFDFDDPMGVSTCVACGECVQACPTGALSPAGGLALERPDRNVPSLCPYCGVGCQVTYHVRGDRILSVDGRDGPANDSRLCVKGRYGFDYARHRQRLTTPLIRRDDAPPKRGDLALDPDDAHDFFREATWEEALDRAEAGLREIRDRHGGRALAGFGSAKGSNEEAYLFQKLVRTGFG
ncbi:MAG TPA: 2Fe-2S iron-sulfur cluster-binding protein, partial [Steroidobacteraceae bacterium]|nr:2Fe-2S iron-sulfur cluster-binding protein [Steroidobacteraceae bacterium]